MHSFLQLPFSVLIDNNEYSRETPVVNPERSGLGNPEGFQCPCSGSYCVRHAQVIHLKVVTLNWLQLFARSSSHKCLQIFVGVRFQLESRGEYLMENVHKVIPSLWVLCSASL